MSQFISWITWESEVYFLTSRDLRTKEGRALRRCLGRRYWSDIKGHGAIQEYYTFLKFGLHGTSVECSDFSTPDNFPPEIVKAVKQGRFIGIGVCPKILTRSAADEYEGLRRPAADEYEGLRRPAWAEFEKLEQSAWVEFKKTKRFTLAEYEKLVRLALAEYEKARRSAWAEYEKIRQPALAKYKELEHFHFWQIAKKKENRVDVWK